MSAEKTMETWAVVALKSPDTAKSRLRGWLGDAERRNLYFIMARKVLNALKMASSIDRVLVVTSCAEVDRFAAQLDVQVIRQPEDKGTAAAFAHAVSVLLDSARRRQPQRLLMIAGDLPLISPEALDALLLQAHGASVCIVPDRQMAGTNALLCSPPDAIPPCFGEDSFRRHLTAASTRGIAARIIESAALSLDIDIAADLALLSRTLGASTDAHLRELLASLPSAVITSPHEEPHDSRPR